MGVLQKCHISLNNQRFQCWTLCLNTNSIKHLFVS